MLQNSDCITHTHTLVVKTHSCGQIQFLPSVSMVTWLECSSTIDKHFTVRQQRQLEDRQVRRGVSFKVPHRVLKAFHSDLGATQGRMGTCEADTGTQAFVHLWKCNYVCVHEGGGHACLMSAKVCFFFVFFFLSVCKKCFRHVCLHPHDVLVSPAARVIATQVVFSLHTADKCLWGHKDWTVKQGKRKAVLMSEAGTVQEAHLLLVLAVVPSPAPAVLEGADQLNMMDSGSWFAIWAMWRRISFFVIIPRSRL